MVALFGQDLDRVELRRRLADLRAACGVRLSTLTDGPERGVRILEFRTGTGLRFTVAVDRGMDVGELEWRGMPFGWHSASGYRAPALHDPEAEGGSGLLRSFTGFMLTCGFDHARRPEKEVPGHFRADTVPELMQPLHGRGALAPARLVGYGADWRDDASLVLWCEGEVRQAVLYGEHFVLRRRIEAVAGTSRFTVADRLVNEACVPVPHMLLYHLNLGWPLLDAGARFLAELQATRGDWLAAAGNYHSQTALHAEPYHAVVHLLFEHSPHRAAPDAVRNAHPSRRRPPRDVAAPSDAAPHPLSSPQPTTDSPPLSSTPARAAPPTPQSPPTLPTTPRAATSSAPRTNATRRALEPPVRFLLIPHMCFPPRSGYASARSAISVRPPNP